MKNIMNELSEYLLWYALLFMLGCVSLAIQGNTFSISLTHSYFIAPLIGAAFFYFLKKYFRWKEVAKNKGQGLYDYIAVKYHLSCVGL